jgi:hypothetical protein
MGSSRRAMSRAIYEPLVAEGAGKPRAATWKPIAVCRVRADERQAFNLSDFPWLGSDALVVRRAAVDALRDLLDAIGEVLPQSIDDGIELFVLNARVIDALDEANVHRVSLRATEAQRRKLQALGGKVPDGVILPGGEVLQ